MEMPTFQINDRPTFNSPKDPKAMYSQKLSRQDSGYMATTSGTSSTKLAISKPALRSNRSSSRTVTSSRSQRSTKMRHHRSNYLPHTHRYQQQNQHGRSLLISSYNTPPSYYFDQQMQFSCYPVFSAPHNESLERSDTTTEYTSRSPPPQTIHYWTSHSTRRLEYAAIDAASSGVRGFLVRLVPDCILPVDARRTRLWRHGDGEDNDVSEKGSVRRYRLALPEDNEDKIDEEKVPTSREVGVECRRGKKRPGLLRKWSSGLSFSRK
ncbi:hypothetical protein K3495_g13471 [Podosphaera aphanis]|nr:hypothetical protein K3495_g13471 [Podosphaera aphanis]